MQISILCLIQAIQSSPVEPCILWAQSLFPVQGVEVALNVPTLEEAPRCCKRMAVDDLGLGQVHLMACMWTTHALPKPMQQKGDVATFTSIH